MKPITDNVLGNINEDFKNTIEDLKMSFYDLIFSVISKFNNPNFLIVCGDFKGHLK